MNETKDVELLTELYAKHDDMSRHREWLEEYDRAVAEEEARRKGEVQ